MSFWSLAHHKNFDMHLCFPFFSLLNTPRRYISSSLECLYFLIFLYTWSPRGQWPLSPLDDSLLLRSKLVPIRERRVYFLRPSYWSIPLKFGRGWPKSYRIFIIALIIFMNAYARGSIFMMHGFLCFLLKIRQLNGSDPLPRE